MLPLRLPPAGGDHHALGPDLPAVIHDHEAVDEVLTIIGMAASTGAGPRQSLGIAAETGCGSLADELGACVDRLERGSDLATALRTTEVIDDRVRRLHRIIEVADLDGTSYSAPVETLRTELRRDRMTELEVAAQRLSVAIQFPLVLCILPSFIVLALVPLVLAVVEDLAV